MVLEEVEVSQITKTFLFSYLSSTCCMFSECDHCKMILFTFNFPV